MTHLLPELSVVEAEALELVLVDGAHHLHVDRRQRRLLFGELGVEVQHVLATLLQGKGRNNEENVGATQPCQQISCSSSP